MFTATRHHRMPESTRQLQDTASSRSTADLVSGDASEVRTASSQLDSTSFSAGGFSTAISYVPLPPQLSQGVPAGNVMAAWLHDAPLPAPRFLISVKHYAGGLSVDPPQVES